MRIHPFLSKRKTVLLLAIACNQGAFGSTWDFHVPPPRLAQGDDDTEERFGDPEDLVALEDEEFAPSDFEIRSRASHALALGIGPVVPWQDYGVQYLRGIDGARFHYGSVGIGRFKITISESSRDYELDMSAYSAFYGWRHFFTDFAPFFYEPLAGFAVWDGNVTPKGADPEHDEAADKLDSGFSAHGLVVGLALGISWTWESGFFIDYGIARLSRSFVVQKSFTQDSGGGRDAVVSFVERPWSWGYTNLSFGYYF